MATSFLDLIGAMEPRGPRTISTSELQNLHGLHTLYGIDDTKKHGGYILWIDDNLYQFAGARYTQNARFVGFKDNRAVRGSYLYDCIYTLNDKSKRPNLLKEPIVVQIGSRCAEDTTELKCQDQHQDCLYFINENTGLVILEYGYLFNDKLISSHVTYFDSAGYLPSFLRSV